MQIFKYTFWNGTVTMDVEKDEQDQLAKKKKK